MLRRPVVAILALLLAAAPARAETWKVARAPEAVALGGDGVMWLESGPEATDLYAARPGSDPTRVQRLPADGEVELAASSSRTAVVSRHGDRLEVFAGAVGARLARIERCERHVAASGIDVSGDLLAFPRCDGRLVVRDLAGAEPDVVLGARVRDAQLAGRFVAWREGGHDPRVVVYDRDHGRVAYELPAAGIGTLALQANGKVAFALHAGDGLQELGWATRRQPTVNRLDIANRFAYFPRMASGRIAFGRTPVKATDDSGDELGIVAPWSPHATILSRRLTSTTALDYDGSTIAYAERRHHGAAIRTREPPVSPRPG